MLTVGIIGFGTLGKSISELIEAKKAGNIILKSILVRNLPDSIDESDYSYSITNNEDQFFKQELDIIIEAAGHNAIHQYGEKVLNSGSSLIILSVGALSDQDFYERLHQTATVNNKQLIIPSAAIAGLDRIAAGSLGEIEEIKIVTRKPVRSWYGTIAEEKIDLETLTEPYCIFEGNARNAAKLFPENVNVSAALSIAGVGFEDTKVEVYVDPTIQSNVHTILAKGYFGQVEIVVQNTQFKTNPKSSPIVAMSVAKTLRNLSTSIVIGI